MFSRWLTHMTGKMVLAVAWKLSQGTSFCSIRVSSKGSLGFLTAWHLGFKAECSKRQVEANSLLMPNLENGTVSTSAMVHCQKKILHQFKGTIKDPPLPWEEAKECVIVFGHHTQLPPSWSMNLLKKFQMITQGLPGSFRPRLTQKLLQN